MSIESVVADMVSKAQALRMFRDDRMIVLIADEVCRMTSDPVEVDERFNAIYAEACNAMREMDEADPRLAERVTRWVRGRSITENGTLDCGAPRRRKVAR